MPKLFEKYQSEVDAFMKKKEEQESPDEKRQDKIDSDENSYYE